MSRGTVFSLSRSACLVLMFAVASLVWPHGGGVDRCGGHTNRKTGAYHVHNQAAYCVCHPEAEGCSGEPAKPKQAVASVAPGGSPDTLAGLKARIERLEARVAALEQAAGR
jgi:hypothetical protein